MKILSWDIGIKNLAYCLIDFKVDNCKIIDWNIINLLEDEKKTCYGFINSNKTNTICEKTPLYEYKNGLDNYHFCLLHKNQFEKITDNLICINSYKGNKSCEIKKSNKEICNKKAVFKIDQNNQSLYCCKLHHNNYVKKNNIIKKIQKQNASKAPIDIIKYNLINALDNKNFNEINYILIENQPALRNPKMKSIADTLYSYFLIRGLIDKQIDNLEKVLYLSPSNKLKIDDKDLNKEIDALKDKSKKYKFTKQSAIIQTNRMLNANTDKTWIEYLNKHKKKDDLCDCYLQGIYFINNQNKFV